MIPNFMDPNNANMKPSFKVIKAVISYTLRHGVTVQETFEEQRATVVEYQEEISLGRKRVVREVDQAQVPISEIVRERLDQHRKSGIVRIGDPIAEEFPYDEIVRTRVTYTSSIAAVPKTVDYQETWQENRGGFRC